MTSSPVVCLPTSLGGISPGPALRPGVERLPWREAVRGLAPPAPTPAGGAGLLDELALLSIPTEASSGSGPTFGWETEEDEKDAERENEADLRLPYLPVVRPLKSPTSSPSSSVQDVSCRPDLNAGLQGDDRAEDAGERSPRWDAASARVHFPKTVFPAGPGRIGLGVFGPPSAPGAATTAAAAAAVVVGSGTTSVEEPRCDRNAYSNGFGSTVFSSSAEGDRLVDDEAEGNASAIERDRVAAVVVVGGPSSSAFELC